MQSTEERMAIWEKVKRYIAERNAREGAARSGSNDVETLVTPATEVPIGDDSSALANRAAQDVVDN